MFFKGEQPIIISIGGSLIVPNGGVNSDFLSKLNTFIRKHVAKGRRFMLITGGGATARLYIDGGKKVVGNITDEDLDWLGIHSTRLNGHLLRTIFMDIAHPRIIENYDSKLYNWKEPVVIGTGWKPGWSTDYDSVILARDYKARFIVNLTDLYWVYTKDPNKYKDAKPIDRMTWEELQRLIGTKWSPGFSTPFDPIAAKLARELGLTVVTTKGDDFDNLDKILKGENFKGTVIMPFKIDASFYNREYYIGKKGGIKYGYTESFKGRVVHNIVNLYRALAIKFFINPKNFLDIGCGTGYLVKWLRRLGVDAKGVEISQYALDAADDNVRPHLRKADIARLPYKENEFELVASFNVLEHLERSKLKKAVEESVRISKKYILHKIFTSENKWSTLIRRRDFSQLSLLPQRFWINMFDEIKGLSISKRTFPHLPRIIETIFLLQKSR